MGGFEVYHNPTGLLLAGYHINMMNFIETAKYTGTSILSKSTSMIIIMALRILKDDELGKLQQFYKLYINIHDEYANYKPKR
jgi:hypothetical protein